MIGIFWKTNDWDIWFCSREYGVGKSILSSRTMLRGVSLL